MLQLDHFPFNSISSPLYQCDCHLSTDKVKDPLVTKKEIPLASTHTFSPAAFVFLNIDRWLYHLGDHIVQGGITFFF